MGHLLATVNPEAAAAIKPEESPFLVREPFTGETVQYFARPGEGRAGRQIFGAQILKWDEHGMAQLLVFYGADDFREFNNVGKKTIDRTFNCWEFMPDALAHRGGGTEEGDLDRLANLILGEHVAVEESVYGMIIRMGNRLKLVEDALARKAANRGKRRLVPGEVREGGADEAGDGDEGSDE
jgi:hypothetical protein